MSSFVITYSVISGNDLAEQPGGVSTEQEVTCSGGRETLPEQVI